MSASPTVRASGRPCSRAASASGCRLARALVSRPRLLLLDEPFGALDALTRRDMHELLSRIWQRDGFTTVLITHDVAEAVMLADRVLVLREGRFVLDVEVDAARPRELGEQAPGPAGAPDPRCRLIPPDGRSPMLKLARPATEPEPARAPLDAASLSRLFLEPRTHSHWLDLDVPDELLEEAWNLTRLAPTSANGSPMRLVLLRSPEEKERLLPALDAGNRRKSLTAPVVAIVAYDCEFWRLCRASTRTRTRRPGSVTTRALAEETALRNGTLQAAWYMLALRALGLDVGPLSGFNSAAVDRLFFAGTSLRTNLILNIGHGDPERLRPRLPRLDFHEVVVALAPW